MEINQLLIETLPKEQLLRFAGDIKKRIAWSIYQAKLLDNIETERNDIGRAMRQVSYLSAVKKYREDLLMVYKMVEILESKTE